MKEYLVHLAVFVDDNVELTEQDITKILNLLPITIEYRYHELVLGSFPFRFNNSHNIKKNEKYYKT